MSHCGLAARWSGSASQSSRFPKVCCSKKLARLPEAYRRSPFPSCTQRGLGGFFNTKEPPPKVILRSSIARGDTTFLESALAFDLTLKRVLRPRTHVIELGHVYGAFAKAASAYGKASNASSSPAMSVNLTPSKGGETVALKARRQLFLCIAV